MTPQSIMQLQASLGIPQTGIFDTATSTAMNSAIATSVAKNPTVAQYAGNNDVTSILNAYTTGDWTGVTDLSGKPFSDAQQQSAVASSANALAPAYNAQQENDTADTVDALTKNNDNFADENAANATQFAADKNSADTSAATNGVLFSGSRVQANNNLASQYALKSQQDARDASESAATTARNYAYNYGAPAASSLSSLYSTPGASSYNANVAGGKVTPSTTLSTAYNPNTSGYQGTQPVAQTAAIQTRAAGLLANNANKLSLGSYATKL